jgi:hypothetical protein
MDDAEARRWLALSFDGTDALADDLIREGARLLAEAMDAQRLLAEAKQDETIRAVERSQRCGALWDDFKQRHGLTVKPPLRSPKGTRGPGEQ